jgi:hypothetical protein
VGQTEKRRAEKLISAVRRILPMFGKIASFLPNIGKTGIAGENGGWQNS